MGENKTKKKKPFINVDNMFSFRKMMKTRISSRPRTNGLKKKKKTEREVEKSTVNHWSGNDANFLSQYFSRDIVEHVQRCARGSCGKALCCVYPG